MTVGFWKRGIYKLSTVKLQWINVHLAIVQKMQYTGSSTKLTCETITGSNSYLFYYAVISDGPSFTVILLCHVCLGSLKGVSNCDIVLRLVSPNLRVAITRHFCLCPVRQHCTISLPVAVLHAQNWSASVTLAAWEAEQPYYSPLYWWLHTDKELCGRHFPDI